VQIVEISVVPYFLGFAAGGGGDDVAGLLAVVAGVGAAAGFLAVAPTAALAPLASAAAGLLAPVDPLAVSVLAGAAAAASACAFSLVAASMALRCALGRWRIVCCNLRGKGGKIPAMPSSLLTLSVGCAPTDSQYL